MSWVKPRKLFSLGRVWNRTNRKCSETKPIPRCFEKFMCAAMVVVHDEFSTFGKEGVHKIGNVDIGCNKIVKMLRGWP